MRSTLTEFIVYGDKNRRRIGVPREWRVLGVLAARYHLRAHRSMELTARSLVRFLRDVTLFAHPELLDPFLVACDADARGREGLKDRPYPQGQWDGRSA